MRNNQPVTQREVSVRPDCSIISHTDDKGRITYVNDDFVEYSGFSHDELMGAAHNIIRHPDMPAEAFRDLWETLKAGMPWVGIVKNRCKNGDFYWVKATASPRAEGGYQSIRLQATPAEIRAAEALYEEMRRDPSLRLERGQVQKKGATARVARTLARVSLSQRLGFMAALGTLLAVALLAVVWPQGGQEVRVGWTMTIMGGIVALLMIGMAWATSRRYSGGLHHAAEAVRRITQGHLNFDVDVRGHDQVSQLMLRIQAMRASLQNIFVELGNDTKGLNQVVDATQTLGEKATGSAHQLSSSASDIAAAVEELSTSIDQVGGSAQIAYGAATAAGQAASEGARVVQEAAREMALIADTVRGSAGQLSEMEKVSAEIGRIVITIKEIADQTNLLALNAAIEAARAGEQGRGFAVVADEVRKLAERTATSTTEIGGMVQRIQGTTAAVVAQMDQGATQVEDGVRIATRAGEAVDSIREHTNHAVAAVTDIRDALREQSMATKDVAGRVESIAIHAEQNAALAVASADAGKQVGTLSQRLAHLMDGFRNA